MSDSEEPQIANVESTNQDQITLADLRDLRENPHNWESTFAGGVDFKPVEEWQVAPLLEELVLGGDHKIRLTPFMEGELVEVRADTGEWLVDRYERDLGGMHRTESGDWDECRRVSDSALDAMNLMRKPKN